MTASIQLGRSPPSRGPTARVLEAIRARIASRALDAGDRLPSIRQLAHSMRVSPSTVVGAYDRLAAEGVIRSRRGAGFYVSSQVPLVLASTTPVVDRAIDPFWVSRQSLDADPGEDKPGCGWLPADWLPVDALRTALRAAARSPSTLLGDYGAVRGSAGLRRLLAARFADDGVQASPEQILLTQSCSQAIDLICRFLLRPGDAVLIDDPCYFNFQALLRAHSVRLVGVPRTPTGPDPAQFEAIVIAERPRLYITNSALHNPTGGTLSPTAAHRVLKVAAAHDLTVVEDDVFADLEMEPSVRLAALDGLDRVVRIGSFSKTLSASLRCGYIAARADWIDDLADLQLATQFGGPSPLATEAICAVLAGGTYRKHLEQLHRRLARARRDVAAKLRRLGIEPWLLPRGGFFLWCRLPAGCDAVELARTAAAQRVTLAPGNVFSLSRSASARMRFNVTQCSGAHMWAVLRGALVRMAHR